MQTDLIIINDFCDRCHVDHGTMQGLGKPDVPTARDAFC